MLTTINRRGIIAGAFAMAIGAPNNAAGARIRARRDSLDDRAAGALYGAAIGDGMGAPVEDWLPGRIFDRFGTHDFLTFLPPTRPDLIGTGRGKGDGRITDDMLGIEALIRVYEAHRDHLDAHDYARLFVGELIERKVWVPERAAEMVSFDRPMADAERYMHHRNAIVGGDPRLAGVGNRMNGGLAAIVLPTGVVNAGDPRAAYDEVIGFGAAHQESYALEAAAVMAAGCAAACAPGARIESVVAAVRAQARDGTARAIDAVLVATASTTSDSGFTTAFWRAHLPFAGLAPQEVVEDDIDLKRVRPGSGIAQPSRIGAVENLTGALAALVRGRGDFVATLRAAVLLGRDCETTACIAAGWLGAIVGADAIPRGLRQASDAANRRDQMAAGKRLADLARTIFAKDRARMRDHAAAFER